MDHRPPRPEQPYAWDDERLSAYLDGELSAPEQAQLEARLVVDPELRQLVDELRTVRQQLEILPEYRLRSTFAEQVLRRAEQEILLSPLNRETNEAMPTTVSAAAVSPSLPAVPVLVEPAATPISQRHSSQLWRRGAIWTAVAAAAVLLLMVTNRPAPPELDQLARHDRPMTVATAPAQPQQAQAWPINDPATMAGQAPSGQAADGVVAGVQQKQLSKQQQSEQKREQSEFAGKDLREAQHSALQQVSPSTTTVANEVAATNSAAATPVKPAPIASAPAPTDPSNQRPGARLMSRAPADQQNDAAKRRERDLQPEQTDARPNTAAPGKMLLKSATPALASAAQEKGVALSRSGLSSELQELLASAEFSQAAATGDGEAAPREEQVLVVYLTSRRSRNNLRPFESLLASNSIELAEKSLSPTAETLRKKTAAADNEVAPAAEPMAKAEPERKQVPASDDRNAAAARKAGDAKAATKMPITSSQEKEKSPSPSESKQDAGKSADNNGKLAPDGTDKISDEEMYYLEAEAAQVEELLRQLRSSPEQFSQLDVTEQALPAVGERAKARDEKNQPFEPVAPALKEANSLPDAPAAPQAADQVNPTGNALQLGRGSLPDSAAGTALPPAPATPAPVAVPAPPAPAPSPAAMPSGAGESVPPAADLSLQSGVGAGAKSSNEGISALDSISGNRRALQLDKTPTKGAGSHVTAYRLRGLDALVASKPDLNVPDDKRASGGGFGGGAAQPQAAGFAATKPSSANGESKFKGELESNTAKKAEASAAPQPKGESVAGVATPITTAEKQIEPDRQPQPVKEDAPANSLAKDETSKILATRTKETPKSGDSSPVPRGDDAQHESGKKQAASPAKRVRVLFVIDREPTQD